MSEKTQQGLSAWDDSISIRVDSVALAQIDLLIDHGRYADRSDFFRQAAQAQLDARAEELSALSREEKDGRKVFFVGVTQLGKKDLLEYQARYGKIAISGYGVLIFEKDMDDLIVSTVESISVRGKVYCSERVRKIYLPTL